MVFLRLISLHCHETEDWGNDEVYLVVLGTVRWGKVSMNENDTQDLTTVKLIPFNKRARIDLYDGDTGYIIDDDDHLGTTYARRSEAGAGEREHLFAGSGARYTLTYQVLNVDGEN